MITFERTALRVPDFLSSEPHMTSLDADVNRAGEIVFVTRKVDGVSIHFPLRGTTRELICTIDYPNIRWIGASQVLVFDSRAKETRDNAWIVDDAGITRFSFSIGDAVSDVVAHGTQIVVTYFDEGVFGDDPLSQNGLATFTLSGEFLWGWNSSTLARQTTIYDCYAACFAEDGATLGVHLYAKYKDAPYAFGMLDIEGRTAALHEVPKRCYRTRALSSTKDGIWLFAVGPAGEERVIAWRPGNPGYEVAPSPPLLTRGLGRGRFLTVTERSVELLTATVRPISLQ